MTAEMIEPRIDAVEEEDTLRVQKRDGRVVDFDRENIVSAVMKAFRDINAEMSAQDIKLINDISTSIESRIRSLYTQRPASISEIQNLVEQGLLDAHLYDVATAYKDYRWKRDIKRREATDVNQAVKKFLHKDKSIMDENANKDANIYSTQRDLLAGAISRAEALRMLPKDVSNAHAKGDIHFHDADYSPFTAETNCGLPNFKDMLEHGFSLGNAQMDSPRSIETAATQITQIMQDVASSQYGGQTLNRADEVLAPYAMMNYAKNFRQAKLVFPDTMDIDAAKAVVASMKAAENGNLHVPDREPIVDVPDEKYAEPIDQQRDLYAKILTRKNIYDAMQTMEYQINSNRVSNGQTPFTTLGFGLGTSWASREVTRCIFLVRILGLGKDHRTAIFPKLTYTIKYGLNSKPGEPNYDMKELAIECSTKRMYPDILFYENIVKITGSFKAPMGAVAGDEIVSWSDGRNYYTESFAHMWSRLALRYKVRHQGTNGDDWYIDTPDNITIKDSHNGTVQYVKVRRIINNQPREWRRVVFDSGKVISCTDDHPFEVHGKGRVQADDLIEGDVIDKSMQNQSRNIQSYTPEAAWLLGFIICDGCLNEPSEVVVSYNGKSEGEISDKISSMFDDSKLRFIHQERGRKGEYDEIAIKDNWIQHVCASEFGSIQKRDRNVPSSIMNATREERIAFLAGMIDADGYIDDSQFVQIGSTNKSLAIGQMLLAESLGLTARMYVNHYNASLPQYVRYQVSFPATEEIVESVVCKKKRNHFTHAVNTRTIPVSVQKVEHIDSQDRSYDVTTETDYFDVSGIVSHNCRSFLQGWINPETGKDEEDGRNNLGVVTVNIPRIALEAKGNVKKFWRIFDQRMEVAHHALQFRIARAKEATPLNAPSLYQFGAYGRLKPGDSVDKLFNNSRATVSLGYIGLYEAAAAFYGKDWVNDWGWDEDARTFANSIIEKMSALCAEWEKDEGYHYSVYGTPAESLTDKFAKLDLEKFGEVDGITDHEFYTNSFHRPVWIDGDAKGNPGENTESIIERPSFHHANNGGAFSKLDFEQPFLKNTPGGHIVYVEYPSLRQNPKALEAVWDYAHEVGIDYLGSNSPIDHCFTCGYEGDFEPTSEGYKCPECGEDRPDHVDVTKRTCGYLGNPVARPMAHGRHEELAHRRKHMEGKTGQVTLSSGDEKEFYEDRAFDIHTF